MAAPVLSLEGVGLIQGSGWLFTDLDLFVGPRDRLALIGRNGAGKTTLLKIVAGQIDFDRGRRTVQPQAKVVLLEQDPSVAGFATLRAFATGGDDPAPAHEVEAIADQLGIDLDRDAATASGGERRRAAIARALAREPDVLLLDEPTNHLDIAAIEWLESWLQRYSGAFVAISHDRAFLTRLTRASLWLDRGTLRRHEVGFGGFEAWTDAVAAEEERAAEKLDSKLRLEARWLERGVTARRRRNQGRLAKLYEMRDQRRAMTGGPGVAKLGLATDDVRTKMVIDATRVTKRFGERTVIRDLTIRVQRGDRVGVVGPNGAGKTTLLKLLTGELQPDEGTVKLAKTIAGIVIDQQRRALAPDKTVRDILTQGGDWIDVRGVKKHIQGYLKEFLFDAGMADAPVASLSGGERSRLLLAREFARESNLLVLDEPTNDLDLETLDLLQETIADYEGTVLIVSHDRDFLDRTVTMVVGLDGTGRCDVVAGGYADWAARRAGEGARAVGSGKAAPVARAATPPRAKLTFKDARELDLLPAEIAALEAAIVALEATLADPRTYAKSPARFAALGDELATAKATLAAREDRWLTLSEAAEALAG